jgi:16S rRNA (uracil1498-N3)-methyltransferase
MLQLFFVSNLEHPELTGDDAHHASRVLRMNIGEELLVSNGTGGWARCAITSITKAQVSLNILEKGSERNHPSTISVVQAIPKSDRAKESVELLTASGVCEIIPWRAERSIGKDSEKWEVAAVEASKQSRRFDIPKVHSQLETAAVLDLFSNYEQVLICHESATNQISEVVKAATSTLIIIGPEGGISDSELAKFTSAGGKTIKLGRPVLRSAHAGLAAVSAVSALMKVW